MQKLRAALSISFVGILGFIAGTLWMDNKKPPTVDFSYDQESMSKTHSLGRLPYFEPRETYYVSVSALPEDQNDMNYPKELPIVPGITGVSVGLGKNGVVQGYQDIVERCELVREQSYLCHVIRRPLPENTRLMVFSASQSSSSQIEVSDLAITN